VIFSFFITLIPKFEEPRFKAFFDTQLEVKWYHQSIKNMADMHEKSSNICVKQLMFSSTHHCLLIYNVRMYSAMQLNSVKGE
jgi:hypothetical protein